MFEITPSVVVDAPVEKVWDYLVDIDEWWVDSNSVHRGLEILTPGEIGVGSRIRVEESIAGIPGVADGEITAFRPQERIVWEARAAEYRYLGLNLTLREG